MEMDMGMVVAIDAVDGVGLECVITDIKVCVMGSGSSKVGFTSIFFYGVSAQTQQSCFFIISHKIK